MRNESRPAPEREAHHGLLVYAISRELCIWPRRLTSTGEYWVVNQILAKQLHTADEDILAYTTSLMDKLEQVGIHEHPQYNMSLTLSPIDKSRIRERGRHHGRYGRAGIRRAIRTGDPRPRGTGGEGEPGNTVRPRESPVSDRANRAPDKPPQRSMRQQPSSTW